MDVLPPLTAPMNVSILTPQFLSASVKLMVPFVNQLTPSLPFLNSSASLRYTSPLSRAVSFRASVCLFAASALACHEANPIAATANDAASTPVATALNPSTLALNSLIPALVPTILYQILENASVAVLDKFLKANSSPMPSFVVLSIVNNVLILLPIKSKLLAIRPL